MSEGPVLLCYDGSETAASAVDRAAALFPGAPAVVLTVWQPVGEFGPRNPLGAYLDALQHPVAELDEIALQVATETAAQGAQRARAAGLEAEPLVESSERLWEAVVRVAEEREVRAVVLGARRQSAAHAALLGSVSSGVVHHCPLPVLLVPAAA